jgi:hypothetical protein
MEQNIRKQLELIEKANIWIKSSLEGEKQMNAYRSLVNCRRKLKRKKFALESNPAAAMYGESQVGKSYLISSLLSEEGKPFGITDKNSVVHNFIEEINPPGGGSESTSLVSRFSVNYKPVNPQFPVKAVLLSPADIALVLCDSFYNDIKPSHDSALKPEEINAEIERLKSGFQSRMSQQNVFTEDHVLDMQDYFKSNFSIKAGNVLSSRFFDEISLIISKAKPNEWKDIFSLLWNRNEKFTDLFATVIAEYEKLNFSSTVYLPLESVLYKYGTLLDVKRLKEIYETPDKIESEYTADTKALFLYNNHEREVTVLKSYLCALSAELVFSQPKTLLASKPFLEETDLLDFPGARSRMTLPENKIEKEIIPDLLIRGKVAYLFNKYSDAEKINIFLFCTKHEQAAQRSMPEMLNNWIVKIVGETPEKRETFIRKSKIPPLFIIGTFFNVNLQYNPQQDRPDDNSSLNYRWSQRFERTLAKEMLNTEIYQWFENWTVLQKNFQNIFLLRDFAKSESISHIFEGYNQYKEEKREIEIANYPTFREDLRKSFIEYDFVKCHFANPAESWDRAASINEDGTKLIIDKLTIAAGNINEARLEKTLAELNEISNAILDELKRHFHDGNKDAELQKAKSAAGDIQLKLDLAFRAEGIKLFGQMMKAFMIDEGSVHTLYRKKIDDIERRDIVNMDAYSTIRMNVPKLNPDESFETNLEYLCEAYEKTTREQKQKFLTELEAEGINLKELIEGGADRIKNFSQQLAEVLLEYWLVYVGQNDKHIIKEILSDLALQDILDMFHKLFQKLQLNKKIAEKIRHYVDDSNKTESTYEMAADISAEILNRCINNIGLEYLTESDFNDLRQANEKNNLGLILDHDELFTNENVVDLFTKIDDLPQLIRRSPDAVKSLPSYHNYRLWRDRLKVGFVSVCDIPDYDIQANENLGIIIRECETVKYV